MCDPCSRDIRSGEANRLLDRHPTTASTAALIPKKRHHLQEGRLELNAVLSVVIPATAGLDESVPVPPQPCPRRRQPHLVFADQNLFQRYIQTNMMFHDSLLGSRSFGGPSYRISHAQVSGRCNYTMSINRQSLGNSMRDTRPIEQS